jgi:AbrB family looped-hinge helix DNA binding protein
MDIETIKMSSKGQIVIPQSLREELGMGEGSLFAVYGEHDTLVLKKISTPSKESLINDLQALAEKSRKRLQSQGISEKDISKIVQKSRMNK